MSKKWTTGCLSKIKDSSEYDNVMATVPKTKTATRLSEFGYQYDQKGCLVQIKTGNPFAWLGQKHYDKLGDAIVLELYAILCEKYKFKQVNMPLEAKKGDPTVPIFISENYESAAVTCVICQGCGAVRPGMWARALCINDTLQVGSIFTYIEEAFQRNWGVIVLNPNQNGVVPPFLTEPQTKSNESVEEYWLATPDPVWKLYTKKCYQNEIDIPQTESPEKHMLYCWDNFIVKMNRPTLIIAHSYGGKATTYILRRRFDQVNQLVPAVALTDAINDLHRYGRDAQGIADFMKNKTCNWVGSKDPLDTPQYGRWGCVEVSAGHTTHEWTSSSCCSSVFPWLDQRLTGMLVSAVASFKASQENTSATTTTTEGKKGQEEAGVGQPQEMPSSSDQNATDTVTRPRGG